MSNLDEIVEEIALAEGWRSEIYLDSLGKETIGFGFLVKELNLTKEEGMMILKRYVNERIESISKTQKWVLDMPPEIQKVFVSMVYQMGLNGVLSFKKMIAHMKDSNWRMASVEMLDSKWARSDSPKRALKYAEIVKEHG